MVFFFLFHVPNSWCTDSSAVIDKVVSVFTPLSLDVTCDYLQEIVQRVLEKALGMVMYDI